MIIFTSNDGEEEASLKSIFFRGISYPICKGLQESMLHAQGNSQGIITSLISDTLKQ